MRFVVALLATAFAIPAVADDKTMLELQLELNKRPAVRAKTQPISYADAQKLALKSGQPIFISVNFDCKGCCGELRKASFITVHVTGAFDGSDKSRAILAVPSKGQLYFGKQWNVLPKPDDVKKAYIDWKTSHPGMVNAADLQAALAMLVSLPVGDSVVDWTEADPQQFQMVPQYRQVCGPNGCTQVPAGYTMMPIGTGPVTYYGDTNDASIMTTSDGDFVARFPRIARGRGRLRAFIGRILHRQSQAVAGYPVQGPAVSYNLDGGVGVATTGAAGPLRKLVARAEIRVVLRQAIGSGTLTVEQASVAQKLLNDPNLYELAVSTAKVHADRDVKAGRPVGKLGDGTILKYLIENLPAILSEVAKFLHDLGIV